MGYILRVADFWDKHKFCTPKEPRHVTSKEELLDYFIYQRANFPPRGLIETIVITIWSWGFYVGNRENGIFDVVT